MSDGLTEARKGFTTYASEREIVNDNVKKTFIFKVKTVIHREPNGIKSDTDGCVYIITDDPSKIYQQFKIDDVISIEKISRAYII